MSAVKSRAAVVTVAPMEAVAPAIAIAASVAVATAIAVATVVIIAAAETRSVVAIAQSEADVRVIIGRYAIIISACADRPWVGDNRGSGHGDTGYTNTDTDTDRRSRGSDRTQA
jgi:hypothetical protein